MGWLYDYFTLSKLYSLVDRQPAEPKAKFANEMKVRSAWFDNHGLLEICHNGTINTIERLRVILSKYRSEQGSTSNSVRVFPI